MFKKTTIANFVFLLVLCYVISPWIFEKNFFFNEVLALTGLVILAFKRFKTGNDLISRWVVFLLFWSLLHLISSVFRMDSGYYYLRNSVIVYSMFSFNIGFFLFQYLNPFITKISQFLRVYIFTLLVVPFSTFLFERFVMSTLFPAIFKNSRTMWILPCLIVINIIYAFSYSSATAIFLALFYFFLLVVPGYHFFKQVALISFVAFICFFIYIQPNLSLISKNFDPYTSYSIYQVINSHPLLSLDVNTTWRLVLWREVLVDNFPANILGIGFGTPMMKYFPVEDYSNLANLPYVIGAHNSYIYLFGRLGVFYLFFLVPVYVKIFKEYFYYKAYYYGNRSILIFFSFFAISAVALFNPALESPIYASLYWILLGFLARAIYNRTSQEA